ncbi:hypothetical protein BDQ17DRAFT_1262388, partial [Cyathus striatus]
YSDDSFGVQHASDVSWYEPYQCFLPPGQAKLLILWDDLGIPHDSTKQLHSTQLTIIGFLVDADHLTITMPPGKKQELIQHVESFCAPGIIKQPLREFQHLTGWINWSLNVFPLLQPGLVALYHKIAGLEDPEDWIYVTNDICNDLLWLLHHLRIERELLILEDIVWDCNAVDTTIYVDASLKGLGIWDSVLHVGYYFILPDNVLGHDIFIYEVLTIVSALNLLQTCVLSTCTVIIFSDSSNTVSLFNSLRASDTVLNKLLKTAVDILLCEGYQLCVLNIPGEDNHVADALSRQQFQKAMLHDGSLSIHKFQPPRDVLGAL